MSSDLEHDPQRATGPAVRHAPRPRLWAFVNLVVGPGLFWFLASTLSVHSTPPLPPQPLVVPLTVAVAGLAVGILLAVLLDRWRVAVALGSCYAVPLTALGLSTLILFGLGVVALIPAASWWAVVIASARRLAWDERAAGGPSAAQRARRARAWSALLVASSALPAGAVVVLWRISPPDVYGAMRLVTGIIAMLLVLVTVSALVLLWLTLTSRWGAVGHVSAVLYASIVGAAFLGAILAQAYLVLLLVPVVMTALHAQVLRPPDALAVPAVAA